MNACIRFLYAAWFIRGYNNRDTFKIFSDGEWVFVHADFVRVVQFISQKFEDDILIPWTSASFPELKKPVTPQTFEDAMKIHKFVIEQTKIGKQGLIEWG